jgi:hypothetical protein
VSSWICVRRWGLARARGRDSNRDENRRSAQARSHSRDPWMARAPLDHVEARGVNVRRRRRGAPAVVAQPATVSKVALSNPESSRLITRRLWLVKIRFSQDKRVGFIQRCRDRRGRLRYARLRTTDRARTAG